MDFPKTPDGLLDFNAYHNLPPEDKLKIIDGANTTFAQLKRATGISDQPSGRQLYKVAAGWFAVFRHGDEGEVKCEHYLSLSEKPKRLLDENLSATDREQLYAALNAHRP